MAAKGGGVTFLQECGHWRVSYAQVDRPTPMHVQAAQTGFSGLLKTNSVDMKAGKWSFWMSQTEWEGGFGLIWLRHMAYVYEIVEE